jgi:hypothetical protein
VGSSIGGPPLLHNWVGPDPGTPTIDAYAINNAKGSNCFTVVIV